MADIAAIIRRRAHSIAEPFQLRMVPMLERMMCGASAGRCELASLAPSFASPDIAPLPLHLRLVPSKLLPARRELASQMPLYPRGESFRIAMRLLLVPLHAPRRRLAIQPAPIEGKTGSSVHANCSRTGGITGVRSVFGASCRVRLKNNASGAQSHKNSASKQPPVQVVSAHAIHDVLSQA